MRSAVFAIAIAIASASAQAEIIDRIVAVVDGAIIMQSDVTVARRLALVPLGNSADPAAAALDALVERRLMLEEVDRYAPPDPSEAEIDRRVAELRSRAGTDFGRILERNGYSLDQLRRQLRDDLRIDAYLQQRFGAMQPSEDEILQYYRDHAADYTENGRLRPFSDVHEAARTAVVMERRSATIRDWIGGLRRRANVNVLPR